MTSDGMLRNRGNELGKLLLKWIKVNNEYNFTIPELRTIINYASKKAIDDIVDGKL